MVSTSTMLYPPFDKRDMMANMSTESPAAPPSTTSDSAWQQIEDQLDQISRLAKSDLPVRDFHRQMLDRIVQAVSVPAAAVWLISADGSLTVDCQIGLEQVLPADDTAGPQHLRLVQEAIEQGRPVLIPWSSETTGANNPCPVALVLCPLLVSGRRLGAVEVFLHAKAQPEVQQGCLRIVAAATELAADYHRDQQLRRAISDQSWWHQWRRYALEVHRSLSLKPTAYTIVNESRRLVGCDRVSLVLRRGRQFRLVAASGVETVHRRSTAAGHLQALASGVAACRQAVWYPDRASELPPDLETILEAYVDQAHVRWMACIPLADPERDEPAADDLPGLLIAERFDALADPEFAERLTAVCSPAAVALRNAIDHESLPLLPLVRAVRRTARYLRWEQLPRTVLVLVVVAVITGALFLVPADFSIPARGELQPVTRHQIFAPEDGLVVTLPQASGPVRRGETLVELSNPKLEQSYAEVLAKRRTTEEQLAAVRAARRRPEPAGRTDQRHELSAQEQQLQERLVGLERQAELLDQQQRRMTVTSPIDGEILTWDLERLLASRPVQRGERLMTVADLKGSWRLELRIDDRQVGHVLAAQQDSETPLRVSFMLAADPNTRHRGRLGSMSSSIQVDEANQASLFVLAPLDDGHVPEARPGASVVARIHCGRRAIGYVWFRQVIEAVQSRLLF